ncbi:MAG: hypothetical protein WCI74_05715, partial [Actinomycetes bacterium]
TMVNNSTITATSPAHAAGPADVVVTTPLGTATLAGGYTYGLAGQAPLNGCVTAGGSIPRRGTKQLMAAHCVTNAGQSVGVSVTAQLRGDMRYYMLSCRVSATRTTATRATGYANGSRYCRNGALVIRTYGQHLKLRINWSAPANSTYTAYTRTKTFKT